MNQSLSNVRTLRLTPLPGQGCGRWWRHQWGSTQLAGELCDCRTRAVGALPGRRWLNGGLRAPSASELAIRSPSTRTPTIRDSRGASRQKGLRRAIRRHGTAQISCARLIANAFTGLESLRYRAVVRISASPNMIRTASMFPVLFSM